MNQLHDNYTFIFMLAALKKIRGLRLMCTRGQSPCAQAFASSLLVILGFSFINLRILSAVVSVVVSVVISVVISVVNRPEYTKSPFYVFYSVED